MRITYVDLSGKNKTFTQYAFMLENIDDLAKRNKCKNWR
jgi:hypothetical protein